MTEPNSLPTVVVVGLGFGRSHVVEANRLRHIVRLVGVVDPRVDASSVPEWMPSGVPMFPSLDEALQRANPDIVVLATPINTHAELAARALLAGAHVLVEKPPTATVDEFEQLCAVERAAGRVVQVGFQARGSLALPAIRAAVDSGAIGQVLHIGVVGRWVRDRGYYARAPWAGRRVIEGMPVMDGAITNPFAHAVDIALCLDGSYDRYSVSGAQLDSWHAHDIESDDTTSATIETTAGGRIALGLTLCSDTGPHPPVVSVHGSRGRIDFDYEADRVTTSTPAGRHTETYPRVGLLENLVRHITSGDRLLAPLAGTGAFMTVLDAVHKDALPHAVPPEHIRWSGTGAHAHPAIDGVDEYCELVGETGRGFTDLAAPWTRPDLHRMSA